MDMTEESPMGSLSLQDMVDTTPYNPQDKYFTSDTMVKILLGAIDDATFSPSGLAQSPSLSEISY
jgi:hypothetical protein